MNKPKGNEQSTSKMGGSNYIQPSGKEGSVAKTIEEQTSKLPSDLFLWAALGSMAVSASLKIAGRDKASTFVGQWAPSFLILGLL